MAATLIGTTGAWGIASDETGLIIESLDFDYKNKEKEVMNKSGDPVGFSFYGETCDVSLKGLAPLSSAFSGKLCDTLALANAVPAHTVGSLSGARNIIKSIKKGLNIEDFVKFDIGSTMYPLIAAS